MNDKTDLAAGSQVPASWWRDGVLYQIYPRSFADSDGDGIGDLVGIRERLDHLAWLGVTGIWLNPTMPSPNDDWGYDVADYCAVHPELGTMDDLDALVAAAGERGIRVLLDLVPNHTSDRHPWFQDALTGRDAKHRDCYVWAPPGSDGGAPNNWISNFGGSAWTFHEPTGEYYLAQFLPTQPDINWWSEEVRERFDDILRFWFQRGVAGFRIDVCHAIVKDRELRDDPPVTPADHRELQHRTVKPVYSANRPEVHDVLRRWRTVADTHGASDAAEGETPILVGETYVLELDELMPFYGTGRDELHLAFNFLFVHADLDAAQMREIVEGVEAGLPPGAWPVYTGSNHDAGRLTTRWAQDDERRARAALLILLTLRGTPFLYYGDEIALPNVPLDAETALDPVARRTGDPSDNRDVCRTPMPWADVPGGGFTTAEATPWLPFGDLAAHNVVAQQ
ncbi:MAG TPA: alpha-amylase family glycosyl hydrolase, partial [Solirubrobacteraceae bacterium]|nr:alpha-amylase family glycosyl hydrolase [Solirubrobacteraceae bacterium]